jgi:TM2 domain-containing membrane protein YozV
MEGRGKEKGTAGLLGIFLGGVGAHHFYLGSTTSGIIQIAVTVCTCGIGALMGHVEGIMLLLMKDDEFNSRYNQRAPAALEFVFMKPQP